MNIVFMGQGKEVCEISRKLIQNGHKICGIMTYPKENHEKDTLEHKCEEAYGLYESVFEFGKEKQIEVIESKDFNEQSVINWLKGKSLDILISFRSRSILKKDFISIFKNKIINLHIGKLPLYRGSGAMSWMIMNNELESAITYHYIDVGIDDGDILAQFDFSIPKDAYPIDIYRIASNLFIETCPKLVEQLEGDSVTPISQRNAVGSYYPRLNTLRDGHINFDQSPYEVNRFIRAFGWPYAGAYCIQNSQTLHIARSKIIEDCPQYHYFMNGLVLSSDKYSGAVGVVTGRGFLEISTIRKENKEIPALECIKAGKRLI